MIWNHISEAHLLRVAILKVGDKLVPVLDAVFQPVTYLWTILLRKLSDTGPGTLLLWETTSLYQQNQHEPVNKKIFDLVDWTILTLTPLILGRVSLS